LRENETESAKNADIGNDKTRVALAAAYKAMDDKFGRDIVMLDISKISIMADYFIIATAGNQIQLKAIADEVMEKLRKIGVNMRHSEGYQTSKWVLLDFGFIIAHIFLKDERELYNLEHIWNDAERISPDSL